ncbi:MAG TPA: hypothetical protein DGA22_16600 [Acidobacterium sp.]|nr:hypothetical protein [Acidobacterium sp.]
MASESEMASRFFIAQRFGMVKSSVRMLSMEGGIASGAKAQCFLVEIWMYGLKPVPFRGQSPVFSAAVCGMAEAMP